MRIETKQVLTDCGVGPLVTNRECAILSAGMVIALKCVDGMVQIQQSVVDSLHGAADKLRDFPEVAELFTKTANELNSVTDLAVHKLREAEEAAIENAKTAIWKGK